MYTHQRLSVFLLSFAVAGAAWAYPEYKVTVVGPAEPDEEASVEPPVTQ